ncbi:iron hydrogenase, partial [Vararia minispora EC-137]
TLTDLNDYITPSQACIKPVEQVNPSRAVESGAAATEIRIDSNGSYYEVSKGLAQQTQKLQQAEISLNDCLACSGCITSAESILITLQSHTEVLNFLEHNPSRLVPGHRIPVLSIAPQSLASLAASLASSSGQPSVPLADVLSRVRAFATECLGFDHVYDTTFARHLSLLEHIREFQERQDEDGHRLPMLASACPGWVCYAEKTHSEMLPFISQTKSPQAIMGTLVKGWMAHKWGKRPEDIYHITVMPCYDKKLEASRPDFFDEASNTRDVDCVLTTGEFVLLIKEKNFDLSVPVPPSPTLPSDLPDLLVHLGTSSGSYLHAIISHLIRSSPTPLTLSTASAEATSKQNADSTEYVLTAPDGSTVFRGATCYGFRNLQNVVRRVARDAGIRVIRGRPTVVSKRGASQKAYDYVEVMACPGGCVNGGGQLPRSTTAHIDTSGTLADDGDGGMGSKWADRAWTREVERAYWDGREPVGDRFGLLTPPASPKRKATQIAERSNAHADQLALLVLSDMCNVSVSRWGEEMDAQGEERRRKLFRTSYHAVESEVIGLGVKW